MKRFVLTLIVCVLLLSFTGVVSAAPSGNASVPPEVEMGVFIDYQRDGHSPPAWDETEDDYKIRAGITWDDPSAVEYSINPAGSGVSDSDAINAVNDAIAEWEWSGYHPTWTDVSTSFVAYTCEGTTSSTGASRDYTNTVSWKSIDGTGGIVAACYYWYYPNTKTIVEFDIVFDSDDPWGIGESGKFDIQNVATHEWGHTLVLFDLYPPKDAALTMYGWVSLGETAKQDLGYGDALGVAELYPSP